MLEKILENWLDSASERSYQPVFVQMLAADGYTVLHSTRHCTLEFGKDILAIAPDGVGCAFQLKGDPRGRMKVEEFRTLLPQLYQLVAQRPSLPGFPAGPHRAYLVSNGEFNEEVHVSARELNDSGYPATLELWSRGKLLDLCRRHGQNLWPSEIADTRSLLDLYMANVEDPLPTKVIGSLLASILGRAGGPGTAKWERAVSSACWATGIALAQFAEKGNHYAVATGWMVCLAQLRAEHELDEPVSSRERVSVAICEGAILDALALLWDEVRSKEHLGQGNPLVDADVYGWRVSVLLGLMAVLWCANQERGVLDPARAAELRDWLKGVTAKPHLWGEGAVAQLLPWALMRFRAGDSAGGRAVVRDLLGGVIRRNLGAAEEALPTPYYTFPEVQRDLLGLSSGLRIHQRESFAGSAYTADALLRVGLEMEMEEEAIAAWPALTRLGHRSLVFDRPSDYWRLRCQQGVERTTTYPLGSTIDAVRAETRALLGSDASISAVGGELWTLLMWWQAAPHRLNSATAVAALERLAPAEGGLTP